MITKVKLKNWRSHLESEFKFTRGTNALVGILGSGKTSVLNG
ncbi:MAG: DNA replication and repair protein RecF, partial [Candidatus Aenigmatarchaeota archaeon]